MVQHAVSLFPALEQETDMSTGESCIYILDMYTVYSSADLFPVNDLDKSQYSCYHIQDQNSIHLCPHGTHTHTTAPPTTTATMTT